MQRQLTDYLIGLFVCLAAFIGYQMLAAPFLTPHESPELAQRTEQPAVILDPRIAALFAKDAWQLNASHQVSAEAGTLLYENSEQLDTKKWRLFPVTMLVQGGDDGRLVLIDAEKADVEFSGSLDTLDTGSSPITSGQLLGTVKIYSPESAPGADDGLFATTRDIRINRREIKTTEDVEFLYGSIKAKGKDLTIHLSGSSGRGNTPVLDRLELIYLEYLEMPLKDGGLWQPLDPPLSVRNALNQQPPPEGKLSVICRCKLEFFFESLRMVLNGQRVEVTHQIPSMPPDTIVCKRLDVRLAQPTENAAGPSWAKAIRHLKASGSPTEPVTLQVPSLLASGSAEAIEINFPVNNSAADLKLSGKSPVTLSHRGMSLVVPELTYRFSQAQPDQIGRLDTKDGGQLILQPTETIPVQSIHWKGKLGLVPKMNSHELTIDGGIDGQTVDGRSLHADQLLFLFSMATTTDPALKKIRRSIVPKQLRLASTTSENVKIDLPLVYLEQKSINLWFEQTTQQANPANVSAPIGMASGSKADRSASKPMQSRFISETLNGQILLSAGAIAGFDLSAVKRIRAETQLSSEQGPQQIVVNGDELRVVNLPGERRLDVKGQTARIEVADGFVEGPSIIAMLSKNRLELNQGGEICVPRTWIGASGDALTPATNWTIAPHLRFQGYLIFDGKVLEATQVVLNGAMRTDAMGPVWQFAASGRVMQLVFLQPINLLAANVAENSAIEQMVLAGDEQEVIVDVSSWQGEARQSRHWLQTRRIDYLPTTGSLFGAPGQYRMWSVRDGTQGDALPNFFGDAPLVTSHLIYREKFEGNLPKRQLEFVCAVRVGTGPAQTWEQSLDVTRLEQPGRGQGILDCDRLRIAPSTEFGGIASRRIAWEIEGLERVGVNVNTESGRFMATCNRFNYASTKDLLVLEGLPGAPVEISNLPGAASAIFGSGKYSSLSLRPRALEIVDARLLNATIQSTENPSLPAAPPRFGEVPKTPPKNPSPLNRLRSF